MFVLLLYGMLLAGFLDFAIGLSIVHGVSYLTGDTVSVTDYIIGGLLTLSPDIDLLYMALRERRLYGDHHQNITHRPILIIPLASLAGFVIGGPFWGVAATLCVLWHFIHDTEWIGGPGGSGIAWFWPFSKKYISPKRAVDPERAPGAEWKDRADQWMNISWLRPSMLSVSELMIGTVLCCNVAQNILGWGATLSLTSLAWALTLSVWLFVARRRLNS